MEKNLTRFELQVDAEAGQPGGHWIWDGQQHRNILSDVMQKLVKAIGR